MKKKDFEFEVINEAEKLSDDTLDLVKGGSSDVDPTRCCLIQFSCNNKGGKIDSPQEPSDPLDLYVQ